MPLQNKVGKDGEYLLKVDGKSMIFEGHIMRIANPKRGTIGMTPFFDYFIVKNFGTEIIPYKTKIPGYGDNIYEQVCYCRSYDPVACREIREKKNANIHR